MNKLRFLIGYLVHIFNFKNVHYININHTFKVETMNEISLSKTVVYSFHIPKRVGFFQSILFVLSRNKRNYFFLIKKLTIFAVFYRLRQSI